MPGHLWRPNGPLDYGIGEGGVKVGRIDHSLSSRISLYHLRIIYQVKRHSPYVLTISLCLRPYPVIFATHSSSDCTFCFYNHNSLRGPSTYVFKIYLCLLPYTASLTSPPHKFNSTILLHSVMISFTVSTFTISSNYLSLPIS